MGWFNVLVPFFHGYCWKMGTSCKPAVYELPRGRWLVANSLWLEDGIWGITKDLIIFALPFPWLASVWPMFFVGCWRAVAGSKHTWLKDCISGNNQRVKCFGSSFLCCRLASVWRGCWWKVGTFCRHDVYGQQTYSLWNMTSLGFTKEFIMLAPFFSWLAAGWPVCVCAATSKTRRDRPHW